MGAAWRRGARARTPATAGPPGPVRSGSRSGLRPSHPARRALRGPAVPRPAQAAAPAPLCPRRAPCPGRGPGSAETGSPRSAAPAPAGSLLARRPRLPPSPRAATARPGPAGPPPCGPGSTPAAARRWARPRGAAVGGAPGGARPLPGVLGPPADPPAARNARGPGAALERGRAQGPPRHARDAVHKGALCAPPRGVQPSSRSPAAPAPARAKCSAALRGMPGSAWAPPLSVFPPRAEALLGNAFLHPRSHACLLLQEVLLAAPSSRARPLTPCVRTDGPAWLPLCPQREPPHWERRVSGRPTAWQRLGAKTGWPGEQNGSYACLRIPQDGSPRASALPGAGVRLPHEPLASGCGGVGGPVAVDGAGLWPSAPPASGRCVCSLLSFPSSRWGKGGTALAEVAELSQASSWTPLPLGAPDETPLTPFPPGIFRL